MNGIPAFAGMTILVASLSAAALEHAMPVDCIAGETCWIVNYVDMDPGSAARDYTCGSQTYNGHDGTDFAIRDRVAMREGVRVLASAPGVVKRRRDGVSDEGMDKHPQGQECGNGVVIEHAGGWQTQYCHLREGSVRVRPGDRVEAGTPLGMVGHSGKAQFPHLHFTIRRRGERLDPFAGTKEGCGLAAAPLWDAAARKALEYRPASIYAAGIAGGKVSPDQIHRGEGMPRAGRGSPALVAFAAIYGVRAGDEMRLSLMDDAGNVLARHRVTAERNQARFVFFAGKKRQGAQWRGGEYRVEAELVRPRASGEAPYSTVRRAAAKVD
jgi:murein DD-endopeptidase MepM/ murein hydrolase activator NlpD